MPSYLDLAVLGIVLVSALLSMMRGFTREVLAIASWAAAAAAAYYFYPILMPYLTPYIHKEVIAAGGGCGRRVLRHLDHRVAVHGAPVRRHPRQQDRRARPVAWLCVRRREGLSARRRRLRHLQLAGLEKQQPEWVKNARTRPVLTETADQIVALLPTDAAQTINGWIKSHASAATNDLNDAAAVAHAKTEDDRRSAAATAPPQKKRRFDGGRNAPRWTSRSSTP